MIGQTFQHLTVLACASNVGKRKAYECRCSCGAATVVTGTNLRSGKTKSCGCLRSQNLRSILTTHGMSQHPLYARWWSMHKRCYDTSHNRFYRYGARGITVCERWHSFASYLEDVLPSYREGLTLDRVDNDGHYGPDNFRWTSHRVQARNRSTCIVTEEEITAMRDMYASTKMTQREIGAIFGRSRETVKHYLKNLRA
jgi:DNA-binding CsgD family transcriptional regulator